MNTEYTGPKEIWGNAVYPTSGLWDVMGDFTTYGLYENGVKMTISTELPNGIKYIGTEGWIFVTRGAYKASASDPVVASGQKALTASNDSIITSVIGGTSGKSTATAMLFDILHHAGLNPSIIGGAGLTRLIREGKIGNAAYGTGDWLILEADESDGSIVQYHPEIGVLLNVDKDHQEINTLMELFATFKKNSTQFIVNRSHPLSAQLTSESPFDFSCDLDEVGLITAKDFTQQGETISFNVQGILFNLNILGKHNMENALAAIAVASLLGIELPIAAEALLHYEGIYRRHQIYGKKNGITLIDDFAHNPVKCARSIEACQPISDKLIAWFQPHGYGPTKFLRNDFVAELAAVLRPQDEIWMSEIYYAGGTAVKDISANDLIQDLKKLGVNAFFIADRNDLLDHLRPHFTDNTSILLMGARDPSLGRFAEEVWSKISS
jgi:UDP-N-acetylmuramate--alanine ligase